MNVIFYIEKKLENVSFCSPSQSPSILAIPFPFRFMFFKIGNPLYLDSLLFERNCVRQKTGVVTTQLD